MDIRKKQKDPSTSWTKGLQKPTAKTPNKPHTQKRVTHKNKCPHVSGIRQKKTFPNISLSHQLLPWFHYWRSLLQPFQFGQHQWCQPYGVATGVSWGFSTQGPPLSCWSLVPVPSLSPSCRSCRNPEVRSAQSYNALAKLGFWITKSSCWNRWSRREKHVTVTVTCFSLRDHRFQHVTNTNPTPFWDALVMLGIPENASD